jgi:hypothetical protein
MVFDFGQMTNVRMERAPQGTGSTVTFGGDSGGTTGFACGDVVTCRDSITGPDELVFQYRNPYFNHQILPVAVASGTALEIAGPLPRPIRAGQVLQAVCFSGSMVWAYVRASVEVPATDDAAARIQVTLEPGEGLDYPHQNAALADTCFNSGQARLFEVERIRYFVQSYDATGQVVAWNSAGSRPYLMLDRGLRSADGVALLDVVAPDVEDLQVSYVFPLATVENQVVGSASGTRLGNSETGIDFAPTLGVPGYAAARLSAVRATHHPANIRSVRVATVVRSPTPDPDQASGVVPAAGNRPAIAAGDPGHRRTVFETSVSMPNMESRAPFYPPVVPVTDPQASVLNVGGG